MCINHANLVIQNPAGNVKDAVSGAERNMVEISYQFQAASLEEELGGTQRYVLSRIGHGFEAGFHFLCRQRSPRNTIEFLKSTFQPT